MVRGRKPLPASVKKLRGNPGGRPVLDDEPKPPRAINPDGPPEWLDGVGRREWQRLYAEMEGTGLVCNWDAALLGAYCQAYSRVALAKANLTTPEDYVVELPNGIKTPSPWVRILQQAEKEMVRNANFLGLSPSERSRLHITKTRKDGRTAAERAFGLTLPGRPRTDAEIDFDLDLD